jgi:dienelactone hydrolase
MMIQGTHNMSAINGLTFTRRELLQLLGFQAAAVALSGLVSVAETMEIQPQEGGELRPFNRFPRMVHEYFVERVRAAERIGAKARASLETRADAVAYVRHTQNKIRACFGSFPQKTPLNARITGVVERDAYRIEKVIFESRPGFPVTANLYVPRERKFPLPGVVGACGHTVNGKAAETYQAFAQGLARLGYVVLIFDPVGQGERLEYANKEWSPRPRPGVEEHLYAGNQQLLVGEFIGAWMAWDGIRALDYLLSRKEVDPRHVGVTGNSGGGTQTTWLCGLEQRWTMAAPDCYITTYRRDLENELAADAEQCPPRVLAFGLDKGDFLAALAPKPIILVAQENDFFDVRGTQEAYDRLKRLYTLLGAPDRVKLFVGPGEHGFDQEGREAMYQWFNHVTRVSEAMREPGIVIEKDETLWCAPRGQVAELNSRTVFSFTREKAKALAAGRAAIAGDDLKRAVTEILKLPVRTGTPEFRILRPVRSRSYPRPHAALYAVETEAGIQALVYRLSNEPLYSRPPRGQKRAVLYVAHRSSDAELRTEPLIGEEIASEPEIPFFACDVRGIGESQPNTAVENQFLAPFGSDYLYAIHSIMLDHPYVGQRVYDVLRVLDWLKSYGHAEVHLVALGWGTIPATFAALLSEQVVQVTLKDHLTSYQEIAESERYEWPLSSLLSGVLKKFDLPDCYAALNGKKLRMIVPPPQ